jgi:predicted small secreted protein
MKKSIIYILLVSFLLQSCFSYRVIDKNSDLAIGKKYKIKQSNKYEKVRLLASTDSTITVSNNKNIENTIAKNNIKVIKKRKFSVGKTTILVTSTLLGGATLLVADGLSKANYTPN